MHHPPRDLFSDDALAYVRYRPSYPDEVIAFLGRLAPADGRVWEAGCGSGQLTSRLVCCFDRIVAAEVRRIGRTGAHIVLLTYGRVEGAPDIDDLLREFVTRTLADHWPAERIHVDARYRTLPFPFREIGSPEFTLHASWTLDALLGYVSTWSAVHALVRQEGPARLREFQHRLRTRWGPPARTRAFRWPLTVRAGAVHAEAPA